MPYLRGMKTSCSQARLPPTPMVQITAVAPGSASRRSVVALRLDRGLAHFDHLPREPLGDFSRVRVDIHQRQLALTVAPDKIRHQPAREHCAPRSDQNYSLSMRSLLRTVVV